MKVPVMTQQRKRFGVVYPATQSEYSVDVDKKAGTIKVYRKDERTGVETVNTFNVGDMCECGSYNLVYCAEITAISDKCVTMVEYKGHRGMEKTYRMRIHEFCWRNWNFDYVKAQARNQDTLMYI